MWEKSKGTTKCEKRTITYDVETTQCEGGTIKCEKKVTWCSKLPSSGYRTSFFFGGYRRITRYLNNLIVAFHDYLTIILHVTVTNYLLYRSNECKGTKYFDITHIYKKQIIDSEQFNQTS